MKEDRKVLILTDGDTSSQKLAQGIADAVESLAIKGCTVFQVKSAAFSGTDLLCADTFFVGCATESPASFNYIETLFGHINLAGRSCGIFSCNSKAIEYLSGILQDSEVFVGKPLLAKDGKLDGKEIQEWVKSILLKGAGRG